MRRTGLISAAVAAAAAAGISQALGPIDTKVEVEKNVPHKAKKAGKAKVTKLARSPYMDGVPAGINRHTHRPHEGAREKARRAARAARAAKAAE